MFGALVRCAVYACVGVAVRSVWTVCAVRRVMCGVRCAECGVLCVVCVPGRGPAHLITRPIDGRATPYPHSLSTGEGKIPRGDFSAGKIPYFNLVRNFPLIFQGEVRNFPRAEFCPCKQPLDHWLKLDLLPWENYH